MKKQPKLLIGIIAAVAVLAVVVMIIVMAASGRDEDTYSSHMELAQRYLDELQYEQAIAEYRAAIEIEPNNIEAYLALAEIYVGMGDYEAAIDVLNQGVEQTDSKELADYLEEVQEAGHAVTEAAEEVVGEPWEEVVYLDDGSYYIDEYDADGNLIKETFCNADDTIDSWVIDEYDTAGNLIKSTRYNADGTIEWIHEYDTAGNLIKSTCYNADGTIDYWSIDEYDTAGNRIKSTYYNADGTISWIDEYDSAGNRIKHTVYYANGTVSWIDEYDSAGNLIKHTDY